MGGSSKRCRVADALTEAVSRNIGGRMNHLQISHEKDCTLDGFSWHPLEVLEAWIQSMTVYKADYAETTNSRKSTYPGKRLIQRLMDR